MMVGPGWSQSMQEGSQPGWGGSCRQSAIAERLGEWAVICPARRERRHRGEAAPAGLFGNRRSIYDMVLAHKEVVTNWGQVK